LGQKINFYFQEWDLLIYFLGISDVVLAISHRKMVECRNKVKEGTSKLNSWAFLKYISRVTIEHEINKWLIMR
jgi:hypothetical protein